jgi:D-galactarolactone cycloisomerase
VFSRQPILEYDQSSHPFRRELTTAPIEMRGGQIPIPTASGLGIEVRTDTLARYRLDQDSGDGR